jgi:hypothetical protein
MDAKAMMTTSSGTDAMLFEIFSPKILTKNACFIHNTAYFSLNFHHNIGLEEKRQFFPTDIGPNCRKL